MNAYPNNLLHKIITEKFSLLILFLSAAIINLHCKKEFSCENCTGGNQSPVANAGPDQVIYFPADSVLLDGSASVDPDGTISNWDWTKVSGPASFNMVSPSASQNRVKSLDTGVYRFSLKVTDNKGLIDLDTVEIKVMPPTTQPNRPPMANAGPDQVITLPVNSVTLDGSASSDPDNNITGYSWSKISGPSSFNLVNPTSVQTHATMLVQGQYLFELKITDAGGLTGKDTIMVTVNPDAGTSLVDVYVAGTLEGSAKQAVYWKNGQLNYLNGGLGYSGTKIAVAGTTIAAAATSWGSGVTMAAYWRNGTYTSLGYGYVASDVAISGNDVYVAGIELDVHGGHMAMYWKNGQAFNLTGYSGASVSDIDVIGNDVYVAGSEQNFQGQSIAKYWKNGQAVSLTNGSRDATATAIAVVGNDVYVAGYEWNGVCNIAKYWKNGQEVLLSDGTKNTITTEIVVIGGNVYVAGREWGECSSFPAADATIAVYWKNGQIMRLTSGCYLNANATSMAVHGSDVYVAGSEDTGSGGTGTDAKYWKNGLPVLLTNGSGNHGATSIVVVNR